MRTRAVCSLAALNARGALGVALFVAGLACGCTGLEPAALSAGASVAQTGVTILDRGKARTVERATYDDALAAVRRAAAKLSLVQTVEEPTPRRMRMSFHDERGESIVVVVERRTQTVTLLQTDVGALGESGWASLMLKQVLGELTVAGSLPPPPKPPAGQKETPPPPIAPPPSSPPESGK